MNINSSLTKELQDKTYRDAYVASQIRMVLPFQVRGLRKSRGLSQGELAALAGMAQPRISEIEKPGERSLNIDTLLRIALGLDVALQIRFVPFSDLVSWSENFDPDNFRIPSFDDELAGGTHTTIPDEKSLEVPSFSSDSGFVDSMIQAPAHSFQPRPEFSLAYISTTPDPNITWNIGLPGNSQQNTIILDVPNDYQLPQVIAA